MKRTKWGITERAFRELNSNYKIIKPEDDTLPKYSPLISQLN